MSPAEVCIARAVRRRLNAELDAREALPLEYVLAPPNAEHFRATAEACGVSQRAVENVCTIGVAHPWWER